MACNRIFRVLCCNFCCCCCCRRCRKSAVENEDEENSVKLLKSTKKVEIKPEQSQYLENSMNTDEIEHSLAAAISDRATDEVLEALTRNRRGLGISDSPSVLLDEPQTPDIVRSRSSHDTDGSILRAGRGTILPKIGLESPTATPHMINKKHTTTRKIRPQSVVENLSLGHIPDLLESPSSHRASSKLSPHNGNNVSGNETNANNGSAAENDNYATDDMGGDEGCDSITELPSTSFQLQHLVKGRPKRAKTRAPTRPLVAVDNGGMGGGSIIGFSVQGRDIGEGLEHFFRPGSVTPTTLTPLVSPTSEECSSLSFVDSPTMSRDGNGHMTSEETTPILEERKPIKLDRSSPLLKSTCSAQWNTRSRSTDNLEKYSPLVGRKSPLVKMRTESGSGAEEANNHALKVRNEARDEKTRSPSNDSIKSHGGGDNSVIVKAGNGILRTPIVLQKPRPWSVVGSEPKTNNEAQNATNESNKTTPEKLVEDVELLPFGQSTGGSIVGITPGIAIAGGGSGGGSIVGITPGAALEKKSVRELAAGLSRLDLPLKPKVLPRSLLTSKTASLVENIESNITTNTTTEANESMSQSTSMVNATSNLKNSTATTTTTTTTTTTIINNTITESSAKIITSSSINNETNETFTKTIISENGGNNNNNNNTENSHNNQSIGQRLKISSSHSDVINEIRKRNRNNSASTSTTVQHVNEERSTNNIGNVSNGLGSVINVIAPKRIAGKEITALFEETLVEGLQQRNVGRRTLRDTLYTNEDVVDL